MKIKIIAIAAMDEARVIGVKNQLPWQIPEDLKRFSLLTVGHAVLMGRRTFESLPAAFRPLPKRKNIVISSTLPEQKGVEIFQSPEGVFKALEEEVLKLPTDKLWVIGGESLYRQTLEYWDEVYLTLVQGKHQGDAFFPEFEEGFKLVSKDEHPGFSFCHFER
jgi:dihydrofolate reductase